MRDKIDLRLTCSVCGERLGLSNDTNKTKKEGHNAFNLSIDFSVEPCKKCYEKGQAPAMLLKKLIETIK